MLPLLLALVQATPGSAAGLTATEIRRIAASDARQGVASGPHGLYAIDNRAIARIDPASGKVVARWEGDAEHFKHINSCTVVKDMLVCAASNYPDVPQASRTETFDAKSLKHLATHELGAGYGSLTWALWHDGSWWLGFANYDGKGGMPGHDHSFTTLMRADKEFKEQAHWLFPKAVLDDMAPRSASGGAWGKDGLLYVTGHDNPTLFALRVPKAGDRLELVATIGIPTGGQAIDWDVKRPRHLWSIERKTTELVETAIPEVVK